MKILIISRDCSGSNIALRLKNEGCNVKLYVHKKENRKALDGMVEKTDSWRTELKWVGKDGLIVFDDVGFGKYQDKLKKKGYSVVGGGHLGDKLEMDRQYGQKIFSVVGINTLPTINFRSFNETINFLKKNSGPWVIKQNGHTEKSFNYVGRMNDNRDTISLLETYNHLYHPARVNIDIQERVYGLEVAIARYFNGKDWVGPICMSIEHKDFFTGNLGPKTCEMGTLMWYTADENNKLFKETLEKIKDFLIKINYQGQFDINSILTKDKVYPLEATARFGYPQFELQTEFHISPWHKFLKAIADGKKFDLKWKKGYGIVNLIACPPFPYGMGNRKFFVENTEIIFKKKFSSEDWKHIHFNEAKKEGKKYLIAENEGYVMHVSGRDNSIEKARKKVEKLIDNIVIPKMYYRTDIGLKFIQEDQTKLHKWGWI